MSKGAIPAIDRKYKDSDHGVYIKAEKEQQTMKTEFLMLNNNTKLIHIKTSTSKWIQNAFSRFELLSKK